MTSRAVLISSPARRTFGTTSSPPQPAQVSPCCAPRPVPGSSPDEAVVAATPCAQVAWMMANLVVGWEVVAQELVSRGGRSYDVLQLRWRDGSVGRIYFDVTDAVGPMGVRPAAGFQVGVEDGRLSVTQGPQCTLPSADSACRLMSGDLSALPSAAFHTLGRAALIAVGIYAAGERDPGKLARYSVGAAVAIEAFALAWAASQQPR